MQHQWEEVSIKIEVERIAGHEGATKAELHGYQPSHEDCTEYFREFLETLAPNDIHQEGYFVAYVKYIEDHRCSCATSEDSEQVEFQSPASKDDGLGELEDIAPLDGEATVNEGNDDEAAGNEGSDDKDPTV